MNRILTPVRLIVFGFLFLFVSFSSFAQCGCTFVIGLLPTEYVFDGAAKGVKPGDKICFKSGIRTGFGFKNVNGTPTNPVTITNMCDGKVWLQAPANWGNALETLNSTYFHFTGSGNPNEQYGIEISGADQGANFHGFSNHFEVDHLYVHGTQSSGILAKTDPSCDPASWRGNFVLQGFSIHDNFIENTGTEGFYIGNSHYDFGVTKTCNGVATHIDEHDVRDVQIYNNYIKDAGNEGIQVGATKNVVVHHNIVQNPGSKNLDPAQSNGMQAGSGTQMTAYNNIINGGRGYGIYDGGGGGTYYNNIVMNALSGGMELQDIAPNFADKGWNIFNNTFINCKDFGVWMYSENPKPSYFYNNIQVGQNQANYKYVVFNNPSKNIWLESNNIRTQDITSLKFANAASADFHLLVGSPAIDAGKDLSSYLVNFDYDGKSKPKGTGFDIGAFEFQPNGPHSNAGPDQTFSLPTSTAVMPGSGTSATGITSYTWTKKSGGAATLTNANTATLSVAGLLEGVYVFTLQVTDASGSDFDDVTITVLPLVANQNPTANAGLDKSITLPTNTVVINGIGTDPDGSIATYAWTQTSGTTATMSGAGTPNLTLTSLIQGVYTFQLTVTDNKGATGSDAVTVTVNAAAVNQPPIVNGGGDKIVYLPANSTSMTATASDPDGSIASILWVKKTGGAATLTGANTLAATASGLAAGVYVFTVTATDNKGLAVSADVTVTVILANQSPIASAGLDKQLTLPTNSINITGSGFDPDGVVTSFQWVQVSGPACTLQFANSPIVAVTNMVQGSYVFGLTVKDNDGATGYDEMKVDVSVAPPGPNELPLAFAGGNYSFSLPTNVVNLYGSGFDPDGTIVSYAWVKITGGTATLTNAGSPTLTVSNLVVGQYKFGLTVTDDKGATDSDVAIVTVSDANTNVAPVADAGAGKIVRLPQTTINLDGSGVDPDGTIAGYAWSQVSGAPATIVSPGLPSTTIQNLAEGDYVFRLMVTDNAGATDFDDVAVHVVTSATNLPPVVSAGPDITILSPQNSLTINASATDDGTITKYLWTKLGGPAATLVDPSVLNLALQNLIEGIYFFQLAVTDNAGATVFDVVKVSVLPAAFQAPIVNAGNDVEIVLPTNQVSLTGTASSPNGTITNITWSKVLGPAATLSGVNSLTLLVTNMVEGTYVFKLSATDNNNNTVTDNVQVIVHPIPGNAIPVVFAGVNASIQLPVSQISLSGTATDSDGSIAGVQWTQFQGPTPATLTGAQTLTVNASNLTAGTYIFRLTATDNLGAKGFADVSISVVSVAISNPDPIVFAGRDTTLIFPDDHLEIQGSAVDSTSTITSYQWEQISGDPANFTSSNGTVLNVTDLKLGQYGFRLSITDDNLKTASDDIIITVIEQNQDIPKFFSPNNDAIGQFWVFKNVDAYKQCKISIFSRTGQVVYEATPYQNNWDGTYNGRPLGDGDYYYNLKCDSGGSVNGAVRIIR